MFYVSKSQCTCILIYGYTGETVSAVIKNDPTSSFMLKFFFIRMRRVRPNVRMRFGIFLEFMIENVIILMYNRKQNDSVRFFYTN